MNVDVRDVKTTESIGITKERKRETIGEQREGGGRKRGKGKERGTLG